MEHSGHYHDNDGGEQKQRRGRQRKRWRDGPSFFALNYFRVLFSTVIFCYCYILDYASLGEKEVEIDACLA